MAVRDQAYELRKLIRRLMPSASKPQGTPPRLISVAGGRPGVGTTTVALNLATALSQQGRRVVLVDHNFQHGNVAALCNLTHFHTVADIWDGTRTIHEVLQPGPAGIQIVPAPSIADAPATAMPIQQHRLMDQLKSLGRHADFVLIDLGASRDEFAQRIWQYCDHSLVITTSDPDSILDGYAMIKGVRDQLEPTNEVGIVINQTSAELAHDVYRRIQDSVQRFLGLNTFMAGAVPTEPTLIFSDAGGQPRAAAYPLVAQSPASPAARSLDRIASQLASRPIPIKVPGQLTAA